jgi:hypothetical protein
MSAARRSLSLRPRPVLMAAAFLALVLQLMFPAGFMAAEPGQAHGFPIVICSAQGHTVADWDAVAPHKKAPAQKGMAHCPFAGHALASDVPPPAAIAAPVAFVRTAAPARPHTALPGRGLAAPPPPATGPPSLV